MPNKTLNVPLGPKRFPGERESNTFWCASRCKFYISLGIPSLLHKSSLQRKTLA